ncbi:MAG: prepilin-type N-terminal cleavage/methylation domain-containing protein [Candidatus Yanofskybacteria bacterium]|nr:prepilin-type N-terminal cleavage/methylation domain-containing protein [Candidatus Yanofskybacteria bacterium]
MITIFNKKTNAPKNGFTIVEVLVSSLVFSIIAMSISAIFVQIIGLQRRTLANQKIQNDSLFVLEMMSRDIRVSRIASQESPNCDLTTLTITHPTKNTIIYRVTNGYVEKSENGGSFLTISSQDVNFTRMNFCVKGSGINDNQTPRVAILTTVENRTGQEILKINLQTSVSSRDVLDEFQYP